MDKHNKFSERVFAYTDMLLKTQPNVTTISMEATVMFCLNRTMAWLNKKSDEEVSNLLREARSSGRKLMQKYKDRQQYILDRRRADMQKKQEEMERMREKCRKDLEKYTDEIVYFGLWYKLIRYKRWSLQYQLSKRRKKHASTTALSAKSPETGSK